MKKLLVNITMFLFLVLFGYTSASKLYSPARFQRQMNHSELLKPYSAFLSYTVPVTELIICLFLAFSFPLGSKRISSQKIGLYSASLLMLLFTIYVLVTLIFYSTNLPCACAALFSKMSWKHHLIFNTCFLALGCVSIYIAEKNKNILSV